MDTVRDLFARRTHTTAGALVVLVALMATSLTACNGDDRGSDTESSPSADSSPGDATGSESESSEPVGTPIDRPTYTANLPQGWSDTTDQAMITPLPNDFQSEAGSAGTGDADSADVVTFEDSDYGSIQERKPLGLESAKDVSAQQKFDGAGTFADEDAIRFAGPGADEGSFTLTYEFLHGEILYQLRVESFSGKQGAQSIIKEIESTWEWK